MEPERLMTDSVMGGVLSGLSVMHMFEQIPCMSFVLSDREADGEPLVDEPSANGLAEEVE